MKRLLTAAGLLISLACAYFFLHSVAAHWHVFTQMSWGAWVWPALVLALIMYVSTYALVTFAWGLSLKALDHPLHYRDTLQILLLSQFAKYLPGNVGHHVGRVLLAKRKGLPTDTVLGSMFLDTLIVLAAALASSLPSLHLLIQVASDKGSTHVRMAAILIAILTAILSVALAFSVTRRMLVQHVRHLSQLVRTQKLPLLCSAWATHCLSFMTGGTILYLLCLAFSNSPHPQYWLDVTGIYASAWLLGFLIPGAPAGLGVREIVLLLGLSPLFGIEGATAAAAALRLITTLGDGLALVLGLVLRKLQQAGSGTANTGSLS
ncbi:flippase-like domain-containing protein [Rhodanobacter sp. B2A1Ga4]|uniref:lysylphosphatidylglycerol synthase transmembrane domain-containing protein n=1 Tax=Rhodanobacter sp. B2A1Ga4 TaxID=2778647 RepID=UPI001B37E5CE|nr:lysylphosphatidylglycerol synthase transmembrane domain-containing protein [Rhodanobacter sp. B2A1Ga4]MBQ4854714.1 flippase-like domain-containing protein [Rhodanobacter sp. B2A1Ga4]